MKKQVFPGLTMILCLFSSGLFAQLHVPDAAKTAFHKAYPKVQHAKWEKENGNFEGNWKQDGHDYSALFSPSGAFQQSEEDITIGQLPKQAQLYMSKNVKAKVKEASLNKDANGTITYEADAKGKAYSFDENGAFLKVGSGD